MSDIIAVLIIGAPFLAVGIVYALLTFNAIMVAVFVWTGDTERQNNSLLWLILYSVWLGFHRSAS